MDQQQKGINMKALIRAAAVIVALSTPFAAFAQSNDQISRQEVHSQLVQVEHAGYQPGRKDLKYPANLQAADARLGNNTPDSVGGVPNETSFSHAGTPHSLAGNSMYTHR